MTFVSHRQASCIAAAARNAQGVAHGVTPAQRGFTPPQSGFTPPQSGFTLVELVITLTLISIAALGVGYALSLGLGHESDSLWQTKATALATAYFEEIESRRYDETSPVGGVPPCSPATVACSAAPAFNDGETRAQFDDVDDYNALVDAPPRDAEGNVRAGYDRYRVDVSVGYVSGAIATSLGLDAVTDAKRIDVAVTAPDGGVLRFSSLRANF